MLVEQSVHLALVLSDYAYVLVAGNVGLEGASSKMARDPDARKAYLGM